ncbi:hypothetical protein HF086_000446 [Spodoptera exigua]|uniref:Uncharacterized protein n=1 Tax=Spodoptera exigua TaxID=7107 RepID=A0A922MYS1_SPOEX|nr:hypothetical protein HF086_000446 [Spodoptera exigua]
MSKAGNQTNILNQVYLNPFSFSHR